MADLMTTLTDWKLLFKEVASSVVVKKGVRSSSEIKGALVTVWERMHESGRDVHLLVRASNDRKENESATWLSISREWHPRLKFQQRLSLRISPPAYAVRV